MCSCLWEGVKGLARSFVWEVAALVQTPAQVVLVGLDSSGKSTVLFRLKYGQYVNAVPTVGFNTEKIRTGGAAWLAWDVGGAERVRPLWRSYTRATDALIFVVDSSCNEERLEEARVELQRLAKDQTTQCQALNIPRPPILILANKQDLPGSREPHLLAKSLGLMDFSDLQPWAVSPACAITGEGLEEAMSTLHQLVLKSKKSASS